MGPRLAQKFQGKKKGSLPTRYKDLLYIYNGENSGIRSKKPMNKNTESKFKSVCNTEI